MEIDTLKKIIDNSYITQELVSSLNETVNEYGITTNLRLSHFLAQIIHESGGFKYTEEIASGSAYEGRQDLGNINQGDGIKFKGRGLIQLTGRNNYQDLSDAFGINFIKTPELLSQYPASCLSAGWYWNEKNLNQYADLDNIEKITIAINGGLNGYSDRCNWLIKCKSILI